MDSSSVQSHSVSNLAVSDTIIDDTIPTASPAERSDMPATGSIQSVRRGLTTASGNGYDTLTSIFLISNLHCWSCRATVRQHLAPLSQNILSSSTNNVTRELIVIHRSELRMNEILRVLLKAGLEVECISVTEPSSSSSAGNNGGNSQAGRLKARSSNNNVKGGYLFEELGEKVLAAFEKGRRRKSEVGLCDMCMAKYEQKVRDNGPVQGCFASPSRVAQPLKAFLGPKTDSGSAGDNAHCGFDGAMDEDYPTLTNKPTYHAVGPLSASTTLSMGQAPCRTPEAARHNEGAQHNEDARHNAFGTTNVSSEKTALQKKTEIRAWDEAMSEDGMEHRLSAATMSPFASSLYEAVFSIEGMTCSVCTGKVSETIEALSGVKSVEVALMTNSATVRFEGLNEFTQKIVDEVEDIGYGCTLESIKEINKDGADNKPVERTVQVKIEGMFCG